MTLLSLLIDSLKDGGAINGEDEGNIYSDVIITLNNN